MLAWLYRQHPDTFLALELDDLYAHVAETEQLFGKLAELRNSRSS